MGTQVSVWVQFMGTSKNYEFIKMDIEEYGRIGIFSTSKQDF